MPKVTKDDLLDEARFLTERVNDFSYNVDDGDAEHVSSQFSGHVGPSLARMKSLFEDFDEMNIRPRKITPPTKKMIRAGEVALQEALEGAPTKYPADIAGAVYTAMKEAQ